MQEERCIHLWEMTNAVPCLIVIKRCFHCAKISTCFTFHNKPPLARRDNIEKKRRFDYDQKTFIRKIT